MTTADLSALATAAAVIVVGIQAYYTRRAVEVAEQGTELSRAMATEAAKTRLDARAPKVTVESADVEWPPLEPTRYAGGTANSLTLGRSYHLPKDGTEPIMVRMQVRVTNHCAHSVRIDLRNMVPTDWVAGDPKPENREIRAGGDEDFYVQDIRTVTDWVENQRQREGGTEPDPIVGHMSLSDAYDDGVIDRWEFRLVGVPLTRDTNRDGVWKVASKTRSVDGHPTMAGDLRPMQRDYYLSKVAKQKLT